MLHHSHSNNGPLGSGPAEAPTSSGSEPKLSIEHRTGSLESMHSGLAGECVCQARPAASMYTQYLESVHSGHAGQ